MSATTSTPINALIGGSTDTAVRTVRQKRHERSDQYWHTDTIELLANPGVTPPLEPARTLDRASIQYFTFAPPARSTLLGEIKQRRDVDHATHEPSPIPPTLQFPRTLSCMLGRNANFALKEHYYTMHAPSQTLRCPRVTTYLSEQADVDQAPSRTKIMRYINLQYKHTRTAASRKKNKPTTLRSSMHPARSLRFCTLLTHG